jgi:hypothetical protein
MRKLFAALTALAFVSALFAGGLRSATATPAAAEHRLLGGFHAECRQLGPPTEDPVRVAVAGYTGVFPGSVRAEGSVGARGCHTPGLISVLRVRIDTLELDYVGAGAHTTYSATGPRANNTNYIWAATGSVRNIRCERDLEVRIHFSVRMSNGVLHRSGVQGPVFHSVTPCLHGA